MIKRSEGMLALQKDEWEKTESINEINYLKSNNSLFSNKYEFLY